MSRTQITSGQFADNSLLDADISSSAGIQVSKLESLNNGILLARKTSSAGAPEKCSLSEVLDFIGSAAQGDILYRGASSWQRLPKGTDGQVLTLASSVPSWVAPSGSSLPISAITTSDFGISNGSFNDVDNLSVTLRANKKYSVHINMNCVPSSGSLAIAITGNAYISSKYTYQNSAVYGNYGNSAIGHTARTNITNDIVFSIFAGSFNPVYLMAHLIVEVGSSDITLKGQIKDTTCNAGAAIVAIALN
jgi:hypothetical protein